MIYYTFIFSVLFSLNCFGLQSVSKMNYNKYGYSEKNNTEQVSFITKKTMKLFGKIYGKDALNRLLYIENIIIDLKDESLFKKLSTIDQLVNRIHFMTDNEHWGKNNYWATPLETIGTNYGDTEDIALLKYILMVKVGINPRDIRFIQKAIPYQRKNKKYKENISLLYFTKKRMPLVLEYHFRRGEIYKYTNQFKFTFINKSQNYIWNIIFQKKLTSIDTHKILNYIRR